MRKNKVLTYFLLAIFCVIVSPCYSQTETEEPKFELDHIVLFINDSYVEDTLKNGILTFGDKLSTKHLSQGTYGHYFIFYNTFIEFLYLEDSTIARKNENRFKSKYSQRWKVNNEACPFGFGLTLTPFDTIQTIFPLLKYQNPDDSKKEYYLMSEFNSSKNQPLIYISTPDKAYVKLDSLSQVAQKFEDYLQEDFRDYLTHPSGIKKLTKMIITFPENAEGGNIELLQELKNVEIERGEKYALTLIFDNELQGKEVSLNSTFTLNIKY